MSGLDKIKDQILEEANHSAEDKLAEAQAKADKIAQEAKEAAAKEGEAISQKAKAEVAKLNERTESACEMQKKKAILQAKGEVIAQVLEKAYEKLINIDDASYFDMIRKMLEKYALAEDGEIYFSESDLKRLPQGFESEITKIAQSKGGTLKLEKEGKDMIGGFVLVYGGVEENCTLRAIFDSKRDELSDKVRELLF